MKKFTLIKILIAAAVIAVCAALVLPSLCRATGVTSMYPPTIVASGSNPTQTGSFSITNAIPGIFSNSVVTFPYPFPVTPVMTFQNLGTNAANCPYTNYVTPTNFWISTTSSNSTFNWTAGVGYQRLEYGSQVINGGAAAGVTNVVFPTPYAQIPNVIVTANSIPSATNAVPTVTAITLTNFTISCDMTCTDFWQSIGTTFNPGYNVPTQ